MRVKYLSGPFAGLEETIENLAYAEQMIGFGYAERVVEGPAVPESIPPAPAVPPPTVEPDQPTPPAPLGWDHPPAPAVEDPTGI